MFVCKIRSLLDVSIVYKDINPLTEKNDALVNLLKSHGYEHHGFTYRVMLLVK